MAAYLVTGRGGSGKSTIAKALRRLGYNAFDGDEIPGLARWEDARTGQSIQVDPSGYVDFAKVSWNWQEDALKKLLTAHDNLILCGSASNERLFHPRFDNIFVLMLDPGTQRHRLQSRKDSYGKDPRQLAELPARQLAFAKEMLAAGAIGIDSTQAVDDVVKEILQYVDFR